MAENKSSEEVDYTKGEGRILKSIPYVKYRIGAEEHEDLLALYKLMFAHRPKRINRVRNRILSFQGFPFDETSHEFKQRRDMVEKMHSSYLRRVVRLRSTIWGVSG